MDLVLLDLRSQAVIIGMRKVIKDGYERFLVSLIPPEPFLGKIQEVKQDLCSQFNTCESLNAPAHITLHMPFLWKKKKKDELITFFNEYSSEIESLQIEISHVSSFSNRVIYLELKPNEALMSYQKSLTTAMRKQLNLFNATYKDKPYQPHITLAFRDLKKTKFDSAFQYCKEAQCQDTFNLNGIDLMIYKNNQWQKEYFIPF